LIPSAAFFGKLSLVDFFENKVTVHAMKNNCSSPSSPWYIYIIRCSDSSLYTGITTNISRRLAEHNSERGGAKYTRPRRPVGLVYLEGAVSRSDASKRERTIKKLTLDKKNELIQAISLPVT
jgi:putative endonuclease